MWKSISFAKNKLRTQILRLEQGFPQDWIYIERKVQNSLKSKTIEGIKANQYYIGKTIYEIFQKDIFNVFSQKITKIRPVIGANGAGKTTLLKFKVKEVVEEIAPDSNLFLFFDFKQVTENVDQFWTIFMQKLIFQIIELLSY